MTQLECYTSAECTNFNCPKLIRPGNPGWEFGYGMAGGGMGSYTYCNVCGMVIDKVQDEDLEKGKSE